MNTDDTDSLEAIFVFFTGLTNFNNVMTTQRDLFSLQDQLVTNEAGVLASLVALYKALGGGWDLNDTAVLAND